MASIAFLEKAYLAYFGRPVDATGAIAFQNSTEAEVEAAFYASAESQALYGTTFSANQVNAIYNMLFGRDAEPAGLLYWVNQVALGLLTPAGAALGILNGALNDDATAVANKLVASAAFTAALDTTPEILGYNGDAAAAAARAFLATVTTTPATSTAVEAAVATTTAVGGVEGQTFTLTTGVNEFTGTVGNDTFNAYALNATSGADATTLQSFDILDGGTGNDTLNIFAKSTAADGPVDATAFNTTQAGTISGIETININNTEAASAIYGGDAIDASKFVGATLINQIAKSNDVTGLASTTVAAFTKTNIGGDVTAATAATAATVKLADVTSNGFTNNDFESYNNDGLTVEGAALNTVTVLGGVKTEAAGFDTGEGTLINATMSRVELNVVAGTTQKTLTVNADSALWLYVGGDALKTLDTTGVANGVYLDESSLTSVTAGAGEDEIYLSTTSVKD